MARVQNGTNQELHEVSQTSSLLYKLCRTISSGRVQSVTNSDWQELPVVRTQGGTNSELDEFSLYHISIYIYIYICICCACDICIYIYTYAVVFIATGLAHLQMLSTRSNKQTLCCQREASMSCFQDLIVLYYLSITQCIYAFINMYIYIYV